MPSPSSLSKTIALNNGVQMPRIHLGVYMTSGRETETAVSTALTAGYLAFDSAEWYANEAQVGSAMNKYLNANKNVKREDLWFTTKLKTNTSYDATRKAVKDSLKRSGLDYIDLYLLHSPYGGKQRRLECWRAVEDAIADGEVRAGGVSNYGVKHVSFPFSGSSFQQSPSTHKDSPSRSCQYSWSWSKYLSALCPGHFTISLCLLAIRG